jgi:nicotinate-nucleotide adenylyltransferase
VEFFRRLPAEPRRLGILAGGFNPPTRAHVELMRAAAPHIDQGLWALPRAFPHKDYFGATLEQRLAMLASADPETPASIATVEGGLLIDIARECRSHYGPETRIYLLCGADAAERILTWDYGRAGVVEEMLQEFEMLVAPRGNDYQAPDEFLNRIHPLAMPTDYHQVSSTELRERIRRGEPWEHLAPEPLIKMIRAIYS